MGYGQYSDRSAGKNNPLRHDAKVSRRQVFPTSEIPHKWAHQTQDAARNPQGNLYFRGPTIYSYRDSWPLARIYRKRGAPSIPLVLVNSDYYSVTTAQHQSAVERAASHLRRIAVPAVDLVGFGYGRKEKNFRHARNLEYLETEQARLLKEAMRCMSEFQVNWRAEQAARRHKDMADYIMFFGIRRKMPALLSFIPAFERARRIENPDPASLDKRERASARRRELKAEKDARANERRNLVETPCARSDWRLFGAFNAAGGNYYRTPGPTMLRVVGDEIVTSQGARVPLAAAPMVWNFVGRAMALGGYESAGFSKALRSAGRVHIGTYPLDRIDADGTLHAGCHTIPYSELASVARQLGLS